MHGPLVKRLNRTPARPACAGHAQSPAQHDRTVAEGRGEGQAILNGNRCGVLAYGTVDSSSPFTRKTPEVLK